MVFRAKAKKKTRKVSRARPYKAPPKGQFAPARAHAAAVKGKEGPGLMDLLCLHFKDQGYKSKTVTAGTSASGEDSIFLVVDVTARMPYVGAVALSAGPAVVEFFYDERMVFYRRAWPGGVIREGTKALMIPLGGAEDPHLVKRMEGIVAAYIGGAVQIGNWVKASIK
jgi:hypothetical protein